MKEWEQNHLESQEELASLGYYVPVTDSDVSVPKENSEKRILPEPASEPFTQEGRSVSADRPEVQSGTAVEAEAEDEILALEQTNRQTHIHTEEMRSLHSEDVEDAQEGNAGGSAPSGSELRDRAMTLVDHLGDLRKRLIVSLVAFVIFLILSLFFVEKIFVFLTKPLGTKLTVLGPAEIIHIYFVIGGFVAIVPTIPFIMWQFWLFISPGLSAKERRVTLTYIPAVLIAFVLGISFGYGFVFPKLMTVLRGFSTVNTDYLPTADKYFSFMVSLVLPFGFIFEMPLIILFLTRLGIINPVRLIKFRKYAYFVIVLISFMLTPPEITTHLSLTIPMILLYEVSIQISRYAFKKRLQAMEEREKYLNT